LKIFWRHASKYLHCSLISWSSEPATKLSPLCCIFKVFILLRVYIYYDQTFYRQRNTCSVLFY
jgi:hypothetical protein